MAQDQLRIKDEELIQPSVVCANKQGLTAKQLSLCYQDVHAVASALQGMKRAIHECQLQFKNERWNCSSMGDRDDIITYNSPFLLRGYRETAFSFALTSAGVTHSVALACGLNKISQCECPKYSSSMTASQRKKFHKKKHKKQERQTKQEINEVFQNSGCDHNVNFGMEFSAKFLDFTDDSSDLLAKIRKHNNRVGRLAVAHNMRNSCKCHGPSGSCGQQSCWEQTPDFRKVAETLKLKYKSAFLLNISNSNNHQFTAVDSLYINQNQRRNIMDIKQWDKDVMVFYEDSPSFCLPNPAITVHGTHGRLCNDSLPPSQPNSCSNMCCRRDHKSFIQSRQEDCHCTFHWCCYVDCKKCNSTDRISVCN